MITPEDMIEKLGIDGLVRTADEYYAKIPDPTPILSKPFIDTFSGAIDLCNLGMVLAGLRLAPTMTVLDFGGGVGWLSRFVQQLRCHVICLDPSPAALRLAQELFDKYPIIGTPISSPKFLVFDGLKFDLPDASVDRIISFSAFHHVPNPEHILSEMYRVLKPGGIVGFAEPGFGHSSEPQSQLEMKYFNVLENEIHLSQLIEHAKSLGFDEPRFRLTMTPFYDVGFTEFMNVHDDAKLSPGLVSVIKDGALHNYIFFLTKGQYQGDSRLRHGLSGQLSIDTPHIKIVGEEAVRIPMHALNTGASTWLHKNLMDIGSVMLGARLMSLDDEIIREGIGSASLSADVPPGETAVFDLTLSCPDVGSYFVTVDIVAHHVCWFEANGSVPVKLKLNVSRNSDGVRVVELTEIASPKPSSILSTPVVAAQVNQLKRGKLGRLLGKVAERVRQL